MAAFLEFSIGFVSICVVVSMLFCTIRLVIGPTVQERVLSLDTLWMYAILLALVLGLQFGSLIYFKAALLIALIGFV